MGKRTNLWLLYRQSRDAGGVPSELAGLNPRNRWLCWQFNNAIQMFGMMIEGQLQKGAKLSHLLRDPDTKPDNGNVLLQKLQMRGARITSS